MMVCCCTLAQHIAGGCRWQLFSSHLFIFFEVDFYTDSLLFFFLRMMRDEYFYKEEVLHVICIHLKHNKNPFQRRGIVMEIQLICFPRVQGGICS